MVGSAAAAAAKLLQSRPILCDPIDGSPPGSPVPGILQARVLTPNLISGDLWLPSELKFLKQHYSAAPSDLVGVDILIM